MIRKELDPRRLEFLTRLGAELRELREASGVPQQTIADLFGWQRDAVAKLENGTNQIQLYDYLRLMRSFAELAPEHPALPLADQLIPKKGKRNV